MVSKKGTIQCSTVQCSAVQCLFLVLRAWFLRKVVKPVRNVSYLRGITSKVRFFTFGKKGLS